MHMQPKLKPAFKGRASRVEVEVAAWPFTVFDGYIMYISSQADYFPIALLPLVDQSQYIQ